MTSRSDGMSNQSQKNARHRYYRLLQVGKKALHMADEDYRALLSRHGASIKEDHPSATTMSIPQLFSAVEDMKAKGFKPTARRGSVSRISNWRKGRIQKITALWCALADAGVVHSRSEASMVKWCAGITKKARLQWATSENLNACIEGLKAWAARENVRIDD